MNGKLIVEQQTIKMVKSVKSDDSKRYHSIEVTPETWQEGDENRVVPLFYSSMHKRWYSVPDAWFAEDHRKHYEQEMRKELIERWQAQWER